MRLMLEAAGIATSGIGGIVTVKLVAAAYLFASQTWARDTSPDLAPTMAALDRRLRGIERFLMRRQARGAREAEA
jgi:ubiquinone biosynthesis protein COQ9